MKKKKVLFHQDMAKLRELHFELLPHLPYSPGLAPSDYWLLAGLKRMLQEKRFGSNEEIISETVAYFEAEYKLFYKKRYLMVREALELVYHYRRSLC